MLSRAEAYGLTFHVPSRDDIVGASLREHGEFARAESDLITDYLVQAPAPGDFIDVGANIGAICLPVAKSCPAWRVLAIEAHRGLHGLLCANAITNGLSNVQAFHAAAGPAPGLVEFPAPALSASGNFGALGLHMTDGKHEAVRMLTLDELAAGQTRFVKMDVEGFEPEVLKGAAQTIRQHRPAWFFEANRGTEAASRETMRVLLEAGYRLFWFFAPFVTPKDSAWTQLRGDTNVLALPDGFENRWNLVPISTVEAPRPTSLDAYGYLRRY